MNTPAGTRISERFMGYDAGMLGLESEMELWRVRYRMPDGHESVRFELRQKPAQAKSSPSEPRA